MCKGWCESPRVHGGQKLPDAWEQGRDSGAWGVVPPRGRGRKTVPVVPVPASPSYRGSPAGGVITHRNLKFLIKKAVQRR